MSIHDFPAAIRAETAAPDAEVDLRLDDPEPVDLSPDPAEPVEEVTVLDELRAELKKKASAGDTGRWPVDTRPGYALTYSLGVKDAVVKQALRQAAPTNRAGRRGRGAPTSGADLSQADEVHFLSIVLARYCTGLYREGKLLAVQPGEPLTFRSPAFLEMIEEAESASEAVRHFYGEDGPLLAHGRELLERSGVTRAGVEEEQDEDPTI